MQDKKLRKKLITSLFSLFASAMALIGASFAWFSSNRQVEGSGLTMQIEASANLVISQSSVAVTAPDYMTSSIEFAENTALYAPCVHDSGNTAPGLKYVTNGEQIDFLTGLQRGEVPLEYAPANNVLGGTQFYVEHTVYVASNGKSIQNATLNARISSAKFTDDSDVESGSLMATSVDFYLKEEDDSLTFKGTSNVKEKADVAVLEGEIPLNTLGYAEIIMRFYFDGALERTSGKAYVNTAAVDVRTAILNVNFTAVEN